MVAASEDLQRAVQERLDDNFRMIGRVREQVQIVLIVSQPFDQRAAIVNLQQRLDTGKMLALSFLILVGMALIGEGWDFHIPKGYIYFAMAFSVAVEVLNIRTRTRRQNTVRLRKHTPD
jgi:hypothetical protein